MGLARFVLMCVSWCLVTLIDSSKGTNNQVPDYLPAKPIYDGASESRGKHRLQLLFPLLLRISTRLATLVPTALMALAGIFLFVVFSKKALIVSLIALYLSLSSKIKNNNEEIHIHKINTYQDYNDEEEHFHYHHWSPTKSYYRPYKKWRRHFKREVPPFPHTPYVISLHNFSQDVQPFKPLTGPTRTKSLELGNLNIANSAPVLFPVTPEK